MTALLPLVLAALFVSHAAADETTLVVPFVDPQAVSAKPIGTDAARTRTTYELAQGAYTGTWTDPQGSFPGTATLVEGADYASFTYVVADPEGSFTVGGECTFTAAADGSGAVVEECVAVQVPTDGVGGTFTVTDTATPFGLQVAAATGTPAGSGSGAAAGAGASASDTASAGGSTPTGAATALRLGLSAAAAPLAGALLLL